MLVAQSPKKILMLNAGFPDDVSALVEFWEAWNPRAILYRSEDQRVERALQSVGMDPA